MPEPYHNAAVGRNSFFFFSLLIPPSSNGGGEVAISLFPRVCSEVTQSSSPSVGLKIE